MLNKPKDISAFYYICNLLVVFVCVGCNKNPDESTEVIGPNWVVYNTSNSRLPNNYINALFPDAQGRVWAGTEHGASAYSYGSWNTVFDSLAYPGRGGPEASVRAFTQGFDRSIWFGLYGGGIVRYNQNSTQSQWKHYRASAIPSDYVLGLTADINQKEIWCATLNGVGQFIPTINEGGTWKTYTSSNSTLPSNQTRSVALNYNDNSIWIGMHDGGIVPYSASVGWEASVPLPPNYNFPVIAMSFDLNNKLWIGKWKGASQFNAHDLVWDAHYTYDNTSGNIPPDFVSAVTTDLQSTRWFGTTGGGLVCLRDTTWTRFTYANTNGSLPSDTVTAVCYDIRGNLWIGTLQGVAVYNPKGTRLQ